MYNQAELEKKERRKIIIFATAVVALILALIVAIVVAATSRSTGNVGGENNTPIELADDPHPETDTKSNENKEETSIDKGAETVSTKTDTEKKNSEQKSESTDTKSTATDKAGSETTSSAEIPKTGPGSSVHLAIIMGLLAAGSTTLIMSRRARAKLAREN